MSDLRFALRMLAKSPGFTAVAVLTLALGIGANLALFALLNEQFLRPRDVSKPEELWAILPADASGAPQFFNTPMPYCQAIRNDGRVFSKVIGYANIGPNYRTTEGWDHIDATLVAGDIFSFLGVQPILGRGFLPEEEKADRHNVAVISYRFWQRYFEGNPAVVGKTITIEQQTVEIVGVAPPGFKGISLYDRDLWLPASLERPLGWWPSYSLVGRLKEGVSPAEATAVLTPLVQDMTQNLLAGGDRFYTNNISHFTRVALRPEGYGSLPAQWNAYGRKEVFQGAGLIGTATLLVLLIAATNLANLLLARALRRRKEMATRLALGATRWRLVRQLMLEGVLVAGIGAAAALALLLCFGNVVSEAMPGAVYGYAKISLRADIRLAAFAIASALLVGIGFSILPALHASRFDPFAVLKDPEGSAGAIERRWSLRNWLMIVQVAASLILLCGTGLCLRAISRQLHVDAGFRTDSIAVARPDFEHVGLTPEASLPVIEELRRQFSLLPGVEAVGVMDMLPLTNERGHLVFRELEGYTKSNNEDIETGYAALWPGCLSALDIPMVEGRDVNDDDFRAHRPVALVNESFVRKFWSNQTVLGKQLMCFRQNYEIIGVVRDTRLNTLRRLPEPTVFFSATQRAAQQPVFLLRTREHQHPEALLKPITAELVKIHPRLRESPVRSLRQFMRRGLSEQGDAMILLGRLAALALALTILGIYGVMSYQVTQRTREIGIRIAIGATRADVAKLVLGSGLIAALAGIGLGLPLALGGAALLRHAIYGVSTFDWLAFTGASALVLLAILAASWLPARRATKVDPMRALRVE